MRGGKELFSLDFLFLLYQDKRKKQEKEYTTIPLCIKDKKNKKLRLSPEL
jgi:hypothetical protein